jgi:hypothetical protein
VTVLPDLNTVVGEAACGVVAAATAGDSYLAATGEQSPGSAVFDALGLGTGLGGEAFEDILGEAELSAYAKTYSALLSAAAYTQAFFERTVGCG